MRNADERKVTRNGVVIVNGPPKTTISPMLPYEETMTKRSRLDVLKTSLAKKKVKVDAAFDNHFADVKSANGQPLNDKRNGAATMDRWEKQSNTIRNVQNEVKKTDRAIEREESKIADVEYANGKLPQYVLDMVAVGELMQWRKHPNTFFVPGVDKGRVFVDLDTGAIGVRYMHAIPKDQYPKFRDTVNKMLTMGGHATTGQTTNTSAPTSQIRCIKPDCDTQSVPVGFVTKYVLMHKDGDLYKIFLDPPSTRVTTDDINKAYRFNSIEHAENARARMNEHWIDSIIVPVQDSIDRPPQPRLSYWSV